MAELMLVNPRRRRKHRRNPVRKLRANPSRRRRASASNPRRRRRHRRNPLRMTARRNPVRRNPSRHRRRHYRRNPSGLGSFSPKAIMNDMMPAALGAGGAILVDIAWNLAPLPANIKVSPWAPAVKILGAIAVGFIADKVGASKRTAEMITLGALTTQLYALLKPQVQRVVPASWLSEYISGYDGMGWVQAGQFLPATDQSGGMSAYISGMGTHEYTGYEDVS